MVAACNSLHAFLIRYDTPSTRKSGVIRETDLLQECSAHPHVVGLHGSINAVDRWAYRCVGYQLTQCTKHGACGQGRCFSIGESNVYAVFVSSETGEGG